MKSKITDYIKFISQTSKTSFIVTAANKNKNKKHIEELQVREIDKKKEAVLEPQNYNKIKVIDLLDNKNSIFTTASTKEELSPKVKENEIKFWVIGAEVKVYEINDQKFLKTESNDIEEDNLGELPEFNTFKKYLNMK